MAKRKKHAGGRPSNDLAEAAVLVTGPRELIEAMRIAAERERISVREAWRRAAQAWLGIEP